MRFFLLFFTLILNLHVSEAQINRPVGVNLAGITDYSTELVFTDAFRQSRVWISSNADGSGPWDTQVAIAAGPNGFPLQIPYSDGLHPPQIVKTVMLWDIGEALPTGTYRLLVKGTGLVTLKFGASGDFRCPVDTLVNVTGQVLLELKESAIADPVHEIRFIYPDYVDTYQSQTFTDELLQFLRDFQVIRFMDFTRTNNSDVVSWAERTTPAHYTQARDQGGAWEYAIELANTAGKDVWINIPHKADDDYIRHLAQLLQLTLDPGRKIYLEYSNEVWNGGFIQHSEAAELGRALGYTGQTWELAWQYTAKRSADIFAIFEEVITDDARLVRTIPSQAANSWISNHLMELFNDTRYNPQQVRADALAIAPYFAHGVADHIASTGIVNTITIPEIIQLMEHTLPESYQWMTDNQAVAAAHGLDLISYEGGQHLVATGANVNNDALTEKLITANQDTAMQRLYCAYLDKWYAISGSLFVHFSSHSRSSKWGSWGIKEHFRDVDNPKYQAMVNCVFNEKTVSIQGNNLDAKEMSLFPNPAKENIYVELNDASEFPMDYALYNFAGLLIRTGHVQAGVSIPLTDINPGCYIINLKSAKRSFTGRFIRL